MVLRVDDHRQIEVLRIGPGKAGIAVRAPLHGRAHAVAVAEVEVVAHADLVAVVDDGRAGEGKEDEVDKLHAAAAALHERREAAADAQVDARLAVLGVDPVHVVALLVGDHFERQLVVVAQEHGPLAAGRNGRGLLHDVEDGKAVLHHQRHEDARHDGEVVGHVAFVTVAEIGHGVLGPLVGLGQEQAVLELPVHVGAEFFEERVGLGQVFAVGAPALEKIRHGVQAQAVHAKRQPEVHDARDLAAHARIVVVEVRLVGIEAVPVIGPGLAVVGPVGVLEILEDDARLPVFFRGVAPDVVVAPGRARAGRAGTLEPGVLLGGMVDHELGDDLEAPGMGLAQEFLEILERAVVGMDAVIIRDVVAVVTQRRGIKGQQPQGIDAKPRQIVQAAGQAREIADAVAVAVHERLDVHFVNDGVLVPQGIVGAGKPQGGHTRSLSLSPLYRFFRHFPQR